MILFTSMSIQRQEGILWEEELEDSRIGDVSSEEVVLFSWISKVEHIQQTEM